MATLMERDDILGALADVARRLAEQGVDARIRIVGGAALSLAYLDRPATADVDALFTPVEPVRGAAVAVAAERGWPNDWLNNKVTMFMSHFDHDAKWEPIVADGSVTISVAPVDLLLAMKLYAGRGRRDSDDIESLLRVCAIATLTDAEEIFERYYPREEIAPRARRQLQAILAG